jgi:hypothetical protein
VDNGNHCKQDVRVVAIIASSFDDIGHFRLRLFVLLLWREQNANIGKFRRVQ